MLDRVSLESEAPFAVADSRLEAGDEALSVEFDMTLDHKSKDKRWQIKTEMAKD